MYTGPNIVKNGLVLSLDAASPRSYPGSGTTWTDLSGLGNNATLVNGPPFSSGSGGNIVFDGINDYANLATENQITSSAVTVEVVCSVTSNTFTGTGGNTTGQIIVFRQNTRTGQFEGYTIAYQTTGTVVAVASSAGGSQKVASFSFPGLNAIMYLTARFNSTSVDIFYNGVLQQSVATGFALDYNATHKLTFGRANAVGTIYDGYFNGRIYSYRQYNRTLTTDEIAQNYNATKGRYGL